MYISTTYQHTFQDYPDPEADAVIVYTIGCSHSCLDCHNGTLQHYNDQILKEDIKDFRKIYNFKGLLIVLRNIVKFYKTKHIILQGGDPFFEYNREIIIDLLNYNELHREFDICIYTGYSKEDVISFGVSRGFEFIKCGLFNKTLYQEPGKTDTKFTLASTNQILFDKNWKQLSQLGVYTFYDN